MVVGAVALFEGGTKAITLLKGAIDLASKYEAKKSKIFRKYVDPGFAQLQPVIEAYSANLAKFRRSVRPAENITELEAALLIFEESRVMAVVKRQKAIGTLLGSIDALLKSMERHPRRKREAVTLLEFLSELRLFFSYADRVELRREVGSMATSIIKHAEMLLSIGNSRDDRIDEAKASLGEICDFSLGLLKSRVSALNRAFTALKLECGG